MPNENEEKKPQSFWDSAFNVFGASMFGLLALTLLIGSFVNSPKDSVGNQLISKAAQSVKSTPARKTSITITNPFNNQTGKDKAIRHYYESLLKKPYITVDQMKTMFREAKSVHDSKLIHLLSTTQVVDQKTDKVYNFLIYCTVFNKSNLLDYRYELKPVTGKDAEFVHNLWVINLKNQN